MVARLLGLGLQGSDLLCILLGLVLLMRMVVARLLVLLGLVFQLAVYFLGLRGSDCWFCVIVGFASEDL